MITISELIARLERYRDVLSQNGTLVPRRPRQGDVRWLLKFRVRVPGGWSHKTIFLGADPVRYAIVAALLEQYRSTAKVSAKPQARPAQEQKRVHLSPLEQARLDYSRGPKPPPPPPLTTEALQILREEFRNDVRRGKPSLIKASIFLENPITGPFDAEEWEELRQQDQAREDWNRSKAKSNGPVAAAYR